MKKRNVFSPLARLGGSRCRSRAFTLIELPVVRKRETKGFTLIELLVVIAIIGLLIALFIPNMRDAISMARTFQCANNLKRIGEAVHGRKGDGQERADLLEGHWVTEIIRYHGSAQSLICPQGLAVWAATQCVEDQMDIKSGTNYIPLVIGPKLLKLSDIQWNTAGVAEGHGIDPVAYDPDDGSNGVYWWGWEDGGDNDFQDIAIKVTPLADGWVELFVQAWTGGNPELWTKEPRECLASTEEINAHHHGGAGTFKMLTLNVGGECSYGMNTAMLKLGHPTKILALDYGAITAKSTDVWTDPKWDVDSDGELDFARHRGRINVLFVDGKVKLKTVDEINPDSLTATSTYWDL